MSKKINLDFKKAPAQTIAFLKDKGLKTSFDYKEIQHEAHQKAFTVAKIMQLDVLADVQSSLVEAMKSGKSFKKWKKEIKPILVKKGWYGEKEVLNPSTGEIKTTHIGSRRLRTIFETNMRTAHATGRANNIYASTNEYIQYTATLDSKTRPDHRAYNGIVKHRNDKFWIYNFPPNGWGCRCYIKSLSKRDLERKGLKLDAEDYKNFADNDFSYDTRFLSKENLESTYYKKATNLTKNCIETNAKGIECGSSKKVVRNAVEYIYSQNRVKEYQSFIDETIKDIKHPKSIITAGAIAYEVFEFLSLKKLTPVTPHIYLSKHSLTHMIRDTKKKRAAALSIDEIKNIPEYLKNPYMIVYDKKHENIIYIIEGSDKDNKIAVEVNYKYKKESLNMIVTSGTVDMETYKGKDFEIIKKR